MAVPLPAQRLVPAPLQAGYLFRNIDNANGLNSNDVLSLTQDARGYVWIGTVNGLQRFDGLRFLNCFNTGNKDGDMNVLSLYADNAHNRVLYTQSDNLLYQWNFPGNRPAAVVQEPAPAPVACSDDKGNAWTVQRYWADSSHPHSGFRGGLMLVNEGGKNPPHTASFLENIQSGETWIVDKKEGLLLLDTLHKKRYSPQFNPLRHPLLTALAGLPASIRQVTADSHGNFWLASWSYGFYRYHVSTGKLYSYSVADILKTEGITQTLPGWVSAILEDNHGVMWLATAKAGLLQYDFENDRFYYLARKPNYNLALQYNYQINIIFQDRDENIWLGTDKGIGIFSPYRQYFSRLGSPDAEASLVTGSELDAAIETRNKELWVGSWGGGISVYDSTVHLKKRFFFEGSYERNLVWCLQEQDSGMIWAGCQHGMLHVINMASRQLQTIQPPELEQSTVRCMEKDREGNTLLGLHNGKVIVWSKQERCFLPFNGAGHPFPGSGIESIYADKNGRCWVSTRNGLAEFDTRQRCFTGVYKPASMNAITCKGMTDYNDSLLVVGTENYGLYFFNKQTHVFSKVPINEDQAFWSAYAVRKDSEGNIWFTTDYHICRYNAAASGLFTCRPDRGLLNSAFNANNFLVTAAGKWYSWSNTELIGFDPRQIVSVQNNAKTVAITGFRVFSNTLFVDSLLRAGKPVQLTYRENFITVEFSNLQFSGIAQTKYYYRMDGVDKDWVYGGTRGAASYTNLSPGKYLFHVKAENAGSDSETTSVAIWVSAPFWATLWFRALCLLLLAGLVFLLVRWYNRRLRKEARMKQEIAKTEMMALRAQMNPHFIFNCINSIDALIQCNDKYLATIYLNKFARLIRNILDSSKEHTITLTRDLETLQLYIELEQFRNENKFTVEIKVDEALLDEDYKVPPLIVQPYVENAILHGLRNRQGNMGRLVIEISAENGRLVYNIEDNGVGRAAAASRSQHHSYGMEMSRDRVKLFNHEEDIPVIITDLEHNGEPAGTRVQVSLKIRG